MEIKVLIDGETKKAGYKGLSAYLYRQQFQSDLLIDAHEAQAKLVLEMAKKINDEKQEMEQSDVVDMMVYVIGTELLERFAYIGIRTLQDVGNFTKFLSSVDDYEQLLVAGIQVFEMIIYGDKPIVESLNEDTEIDKKKVI